MQEIKKILLANACDFIDLSLAWGAKLSAYQDYLTFNGSIYGIELEEDINPPKNYTSIDHHGKYDDRISSLEQIANLLHVSLSSEQKLIAANDSRYIAGMRALGATQEEIDEIRAKDRIAQGITQEDEALAKESLQEAKDNFLFCKTAKFTALSDLAYCKFDKYVIYNENKLVFYSYQKKKILDFLQLQNIKEDEYYHGGGEFGFVGIKETNKTLEILKEFLKMENQEELYSYHTFMFPFTFEGDFAENENWCHKYFNIKKQKDYNEFTYFYKHVQDAIYEKEKKEDTKKEDPAWISKYYEYKEQKGSYKINCQKGDFELELDGISLRIFNTKVGILAFNLKNTKYSGTEVILAINDFGRRIYPQFLGDEFTKDTKNAFLAHAITLSFENTEPIVEDFSQFDNDGYKTANLLPKFISTLIEENATTIRPIIDDRMFVISQYHNDELVNKLKIYKVCEEYEYETNDFWYKYLFIDGDDKTCQSKHMTKKLIGQSTYDRWVELGTLFGISRYSFVALTDSWFGKNRLLPHTQTMYFQIFTLLLAYRATIIKFADEIQGATLGNDLITDKPQKVYEKYLTFLNKLYFKEVTAQDQGIEIYNKAMQILDIDKYMNDLDHEINELHNYVSILEEKKRNETLDKISLLGAVLLPPTLVTGFFGMNYLAGLGEYLPNCMTANKGLTSSILVIVATIIGFIYSKGKK